MTPLDVGRGAATAVGPDTRRTIATMLRRWPSAGLAVALVRGGSPPLVLTHGVAEVLSGRPVDERTVFRVGSLTKVLTAVAVLQLCEQGAVELDAPADDYLRAFRLVPTDDDFRPPTLRHLLTPTPPVSATGGGDRTCCCTRASARGT